MKNFLLMLVLLLVGCTTSYELVQPELPKATSSVTKQTQSPKEIPWLVQFDNARSLDEAIKLLKPRMKDSYDWETYPSDGGSILLADWMQKHSTWKDVVVSKNETSTSLVKKNSSSERGKKLCVNGTLGKTKENDDGTFTGLFWDDYDSVISFLAIGNVASLPTDSPPRFCGVVFGTYSYEKVGGGMIESVRAVGYFETKVNFFGVEL